METSTQASGGKSQGRRLFDWLKARLRSLKARTLDAVGSAQSDGLLARGHRTL